MTKLLPCPFCGDGEIINCPIRDGREICCRGCGASVRTFHPNALKAAEKWNARSQAGSTERLVHIDDVVYHLDDIEVDADGKCAWTEVANALTHIKLCIRPPLPISEPSSREPIALIDARLQDLAEANALYGKDQRLSAPDKITRNDREITWLRDLRSVLTLSREHQQGGGT